MKLLLSAVIFFFTYTPAQDHPLQESIDFQFYQALNLFNQEKFRDANFIFQKLFNEYDFNSRTTASIIFSAKCDLSENDTASAWNKASEFLKNFPASRYTEEASLILAKIHLQRKEYYSAVSRLVETIERTDSDFYQDYVSRMGSVIAASHLSALQIRQLMESRKSDSAKSFLMLALAQSQLSEGDNINALRTLNELIMRFPESREKTRAEALRDEALGKSMQVTGNDVALIGVLLPLKEGKNPDHSPAANEILEGIKFAVSKYNKGKEHKDRIGLVIRDTENSRDRIREIRNEFTRMPDIRVIIGPMLSEEVRMTLEEFSTTGIPIISPTATDNDLTTIDNDFFQANPSFEMRGKLTAQYLYFTENKRRIAILNSFEGYSPLIAHAFASEFTRLGGNVILRESYKEGHASIGDAIKRIAPFADQMEGIFIPLNNRNDAQVIISHMVQASLFVPVYGNQDWYNARGFEISPQISNQLVFTSDYYISFSSPQYIELNKSFSEVTRKELNRNCLYGYDAANYVLTVMDQTNKSRSSIKLKMESGFIFRGIKNDIVFDLNRINKISNVVRYRDGIFELVERFEAGN